MTLVDFIAAHGVRGLADRLNVHHSMLYRWAKQRRRVPAERVIEIETATDGSVSRHELRPDIYPAPTPADPASTQSPDGGAP